MLPYPRAWTPTLPQSNSMNVTCGIDPGGRGTQVARGGRPMNRAVGAPLCFFSYLFLGRCPGVAPGWYELTPLASPGAFNSKCPNSRRQPRWLPLQRRARDLDAVLEAKSGIFRVFFG